MTLPELTTLCQQASDNNYDGVAFPSSHAPILNRLGLKPSGAYNDYNDIIVTSLAELESNIYIPFSSMDKYSEDWIYYNDTTEDGAEEHY